MACVEMEGDDEVRYDFEYDECCEISSDSYEDGEERFGGWIKLPRN